VIAVDLGQPLPDHQAQPQEQREFRVRQVSGELGDSVREPVLENVGRIDPAADPAVQAGIDHPPESGAVPHECFPGSSGVAAPRPLDQPQIVVRLVHDRGSQGDKV
jgi:hypothetical protein